MTRTETQSIIRECDWVVGTTLVMFLAMRIAVLILFNMTATETGADIEAVQTAYEANPAFSAVMRLRMAGYVLQFIVIPAIAFGTYFFFRRKILNGTMQPDGVRYHLLFTFFMVMFNFVNDVAALIGRLL